MSEHISTKQNMPMEDHWAIIKFSTRHIAGDERSRTHPGHGYPAHSEDVVSYQSFDNFEDWVQEVKRLEQSTYPCDYIAAKVLPARIEKEVTIHVRED